MEPLQSRFEVDDGLGAGAHVRDELGARVDQRDDVEAVALAGARARQAQQFQLLVRRREFQHRATALNSTVLGSKG